MRRKRYKPEGNSELIAVIVGIAILVVAGVLILFTVGRKMIDQKQGGVEEPQTVSPAESDKTEDKGEQVVLSNASSATVSDESKSETDTAAESSESKAESGNSEVESTNVSSTENTAESGGESQGAEKVDLHKGPNGEYLYRDYNDLPEELRGDLVEEEDEQEKGWLQNSGQKLYENESMAIVTEEGGTIIQIHLFADDDDNPDGGSNESASGNSESVKQYSLCGIYPGMKRSEAEQIIKAENSWKLYYRSEDKKLVEYSNESEEHISIVYGDNDQVIEVAVGNVPAEKTDKREEKNSGAK